MPDRTTAPPAPAEVAHSGADVLATLLTAPPPQHVTLAVKDYTLGALDFATPKLTSPITPLQVQSYTLAPLEFGPAWRPGRITVSLHPVMGRPRDISPDAQERMITDLVARLIQLRIERPSRELRRSSEVVMDCAQELARNEKINTSPSTLRDRVIRPAFDRWKNSER
jgi:hypothetical protein